MSINKKKWKSEINKKTQQSKREKRHIQLNKSKTKKNYDRQEMGLEFVVTLLSCKNNKNPEIKLDRIEATRHHNQDVTKLKWEIVRTLCFSVIGKGILLKKVKNFWGESSNSNKSIQVSFRNRS